MIDGILVMDKPSGWTSHDVVAKLRSVFGQKRIGHTGTLDPMATGVLPICFGKATRVSEYMLADDKSYRATFRFGRRTDTMDITGTITESSEQSPNREELEAALSVFVGPQNQIPPMFSAKKIDGTPLYVRARRGEVVQRKAVPIHVRALTLLEYTPPYAIVECQVSKGTYIRSLIDDIGVYLGCGAAMQALRRIRSGDFQIEESITMDKLTALPTEEKMQWLQPMDRALARVPALSVSSDDGRRLSCGQIVSVSEPSLELLRVYAGGVFLGPGRVRDGELKLWKVLN